MGKEFKMNKEEMKEAYINAESSRGGCKKLSAREVEIIRLASDGLTHKEIGVRVGLSPRTVAAHNYNSFRKINAKNVIEAINHVNRYYGV